PGRASACLASPLPPAFGIFSGPAASTTRDLISCIEQPGPGAAFRSGLHRARVRTGRRPNGDCAVGRTRRVPGTGTKLRPSPRLGAPGSFAGLSVGRCAVSHPPRLLEILPQLRSILVLGYELPGVEADTGFGFVDVRALLREIIKDTAIG